MGKEAWLDGYSGQTTDELIRFEGKYRTDSIVLAFEQALDQKATRGGLDRLTSEEKVVLAVEALEREVNNGGYRQFFTNSSKAYTAIVVEALDRIGCANTALLTQRAIEGLGIEGPITVEAIDRAMDGENEERDGNLEECDGRYYEMTGDLAGSLLEFVKKNKKKIVVKR